MVSTNATDVYRGDSYYSAIMAYGMDNSGTVTRAQAAEFMSNEAAAKEFFDGLVSKGVLLEVLAEPEKTPCRQAVEALDYAAGHLRIATVHDGGGEVRAATIAEEETKPVETIAALFPLLGQEAQDYLLQLLTNPADQG